MNPSVLILLLLALILSAKDRPSQREYTILPGYTILNPGLGTYGIFHGGEIGITLKKHHYLALNFHAYNEVNNTVSYFDSLANKPDITDDTKHYLNIYGAYFYEFPVRRFVILAAGTYIGFKYAEEDRNWIATVNTSYKKSGDPAIHTGELHLRHEAEGRGLFFGAPAVRISLGYKPLFVTILGKCNIGQRENWGFYAVRDSGITDISFETDYFVEDIKIIEAGWHKEQGSSLFTKPFIMPELTLGLMIRF